MSAEDVERVTFRVTRLREGYDREEVEAFLDRIAATLRRDRRRRGVTAKEVLDARFSYARFREGYDMDEVDDFLDQVVQVLRARV